MRRLPSLTFNTLAKLYAITSCYRLLNAYLLQTQFDPDEYWQTLEPAYCLAFSSTRNCAYTWEWTRHETNSDDNSHSQFTFTSLLQRALNGPVRSHVSILPTYLFYKVVKYLSLDTTYIISHGPVYLNAMIVAAPTDVATYYITRWITSSDNDETTPLLALFASLTNWFHAYALVRTYSNSMEAMLLTVGLALLCPNIFLDNEENQNSTSSKKNTLRAKLAFVLGGLGVAVRFTSLAAWIPIGLIISYRNTTILNDFVHSLLSLCALYGGLGLLIGCVIDMYFYGSFGVVPFVGNFQFNVLQGMGSLYGTHPPYWYFVAGLPAITGILLPFFIFGIKSIFVSTRERSTERSQQSTNKYTVSSRQRKITLVTIIISYVMFHSISSHKEFRFLLPILPLVCVLSSTTMFRFIMSPMSFSSKRISLLLTLFILFNYPHLVFLSMVHQRAPVSVNESIVKEIQKLKSTSNYNSSRNIQSKQYYSIHYLMGCHSTPLYSHLHAPTSNTESSMVPIEAWTLDCSPDCRIDSMCESDTFTSNPYQFIMETYFNREIDLGDVDMGQCIKDETCLSIASMNKQKIKRQQIPDFLVIFDNALSVENVQDVIENKMELVQLGKFRHSIDSVRIHHRSNDIRFEDTLQFHIFGMVMYVSFSNIILYGKNEVEG